MNLLNKSKNDLLFIDFNQDNSCISVGARTGFKIYNCEPFGKCYGKAGGGVSVCEMLFCTSLVAQVGSGDQPNLSPRRLHLINTKRQSLICELNFNSAILAVKLNRKRIVVILEEQIHIYDISTMKSLHVIDVPSNPRGLAALSPSLESPYLVYPAHPTTGKVNIFDVLTLQDVNVMSAHKMPITCLSLNYEGNRLATASEKGTVIRVFSIPDASLLYQFRRGSYQTTIYSLSFNLQSTLLSASSESDTVHLFKLENQNQAQQRSKSNSVSSFLPGMISDIWEPARDFAFLKLPVAGMQTLCAFSSTALQIMVATSEGYFYLYNINSDSGGECALLKQYSLLDPIEDS